MSGFLRNLSAHALGRVAGVRSVVRLPYAALPVMPEPASSDQPDLVAPATPPVSLTSAPDTRHEAVPSDSGIERAPPVLVPHAGHGAGDAPVPRLSVASPADREQTFAMPPAAPQHDAAPLTPSPLVLVQQTPQHLVPPAFVTRSPEAPVSPPGAFRHPAGEAAEVHVSIGCIELTAVHEAAPLPRRAPPVKASVPLRDYLARRQERRP